MPLGRRTWGCASIALVLVVAGCGGYDGGDDEHGAGAHGSAEADGARPETDAAFAVDGATDEPSRARDGAASDAALTADGGGMGDAGDASGSAADGGAGLDARTGSEMALGCEAWETDRTQQNLAALWRKAFLLGGGIVQGQLGAFVADPGYAPLHVTKVWMGAEMWQGEDFALEMDEALYDTVRDADEVVASLPNPLLVPGGSTFPELDAAHPLPYWNSPAALFATPIDPELQGLVGYLPNRASHVAVARVIDESATSLTFEVTATLHGAPPPSFVATWRSGTPRPGVSDTPYLVSLTRVSTGAPIVSARITDIRRDAPSARSLIADALAALAQPDHPYARYVADDEDAQRFMHRYYVGLSFYRSEAVVVSEIAGRAQTTVVPFMESMIDYRAVEVISGALAQGDHFLSSGTSSIVDGQCGDRHVFGFDRYNPLEPSFVQMFSCSEEPPVFPAVQPVAPRQRLPGSDENIALAREAVDSAPPLLLVYPAGEAFRAELVDPARALGMWSTPAPTQGVLDATMLPIRIDEVIEHPGGFELGVTLLVFDLAQPGRRELPARLFFPCADRRLLQAGALWNAPVISGVAGDAGMTIDELIPSGGVSIVPGVLFPVRSDVRAALDAGAF